MSISELTTVRAHFQSFISNPVNKETISTAVRLFEERCNACTIGMAEARPYDFETHTFIEGEENTYSPRFKIKIQLDHTTFSITELAQTFFPENVDIREFALTYFKSEGEMMSSLLSQIEIGAKPESTSSVSELMNIEEKQKTEETEYVSESVEIETTTQRLKQLLQ